MTTGIVLGWEREHASSGRIGFLRPNAPFRTKEAAALVADTRDKHALVVAPTGVR
jgi:hypothetical protein